MGAGLWRTGMQAPAANQVGFVNFVFFVVKFRLPKLGGQGRTLSVVMMRSPWRFCKTLTLSRAVSKMNLYQADV